MKKLILLTVLLLSLACAALAGETIWINAQGQTVVGNWAAGEIIEVTTAEQYADALADPQPGATYRVAPWLYDSRNLAAESGAGDE